jgi:hypothetical protein
VIPEPIYAASWKRYRAWRAAAVVAGLVALLTMLLLGVGPSAFRPAVTSVWLAATGMTFALINVIAFWRCPRCMKRGYFVSNISLVFLPAKVCSSCGLIKETDFDPKLKPPAGWPDDPFL